MKLERQTFRIVKAKSDRFTAQTDEGRVECYSRKKNKKDEILAGDLVYLLDNEPQASGEAHKNGELRINGEPRIIEGIKPRKNRLIRPAIANIDQIIFVICPLPRPDFYLLDKAIFNCIKNDIEVIICINKADLGCGELLLELKQQYIAHKIIVVSAFSGTLEPLRTILNGRLSCLAGQSAVGKSTLVGALSGQQLKTGELSRGRGKNTTTATELYSVCGGLVADTPGFNMLDVFGAEHTDLGLYYPEFEGVRDRCRYRGCTHTTEPDCAVRQAAESGEINAQRYSRYKEIFEQLKKEYLTKY